MSLAPAPGSVTQASAVKQALWSLASSPAFVVTFVILLVGAVGLNGAANLMQLHFKKLPVNLQAPLKSLPTHFGPWQQVSMDNPLSHDLEAVLGTKEYIFRDYIDTRVVPRSRMAEFEGKDWEQRQTLAWEIQQKYPSAVLRMSVTYYTGMVDTVAHIPDRCFVADGYVPTSFQMPYWKLPGSPVDKDGWRLDETGHRLYDAKVGPNDDAGLRVRFINFEDQDTRFRKSTRNVTYFFQVNGHYKADPIDVRTTLQDLFQKHGYYAKVELMTLLPSEAQSVRVKQDFLQHALPELEKCLPNWGSVLAGVAASPAAAVSSAVSPAAAPPADSASPVGGR